MEAALAPSDKLQARASRFLRDADADVDAACQAVTQHQSNVSAATGGLAAMPGLSPGLGSAMAVYGAMVGQMVEVMKTETELCLMQASIFRFDIHSPRERKRGMLLAAVVALEVQIGTEASRRASIVSVEDIGTVPARDLDDALTQAVDKLLLVNTAKRGAASLLLAVPVFGVGVGASLNKVLTRRVGARAQDVLRQRRAQAR